MTTPQQPSGAPEPERRAESVDTSGTPGGSPWQPGVSGHPGAYGHPGYPVQRPINGLAIASLVLGIVWFWWVGSILALVFGYLARKQIRERGQSGDGLAIAGIVLGWVGIGFLALFLILGAFGFVFGGHSSPVGDFTLSR